MSEKQTPKKPAPKKAKVLKKNYAEFGKKGDKVTPAMEAECKRRKIPLSAIAE